MKPFTFLLIGIPSNTDEDSMSETRGNPSLLQTIKLKIMKKITKSIIKLEEIDKNNFAHIDLKLNFTWVDGEEKSISFKLVATHHVIRVESTHLISELQLLTRWLSTIKNKKSLRDNESEVLLFAREMFKANETLNKPKQL